MKDLKYEHQSIKVGDWWCEEMAARCANLLFIVSDV